jgi:hypothetical protein
MVITKCCFLLIQLQRCACVKAHSERSRQSLLPLVIALRSFKIYLVVRGTLLESPFYSPPGNPKGNPDSHFLDTLEGPDNAANPSRNMRGTFNSRLCCTDQDAVKVDYEMVVPEGGKYP